jgi:hypothetical protein
MSKSKKQLEVRFTIDHDLHNDLEEIKEWFLIPNSKTLLPDLVNVIRAKAEFVRTTKRNLAQKNPLVKAG